MRLDVYLKLSRLVPRRSVAHDLCDAGKVLVNGVAARASKDVTVGDILAVSTEFRFVEAEIARVPATKQVSKNDSADLYVLIEEKRFSEREF